MSASQYANSMSKIAIISVGKTTNDYSILIKHLIKMIRWNISEHIIQPPNIQSHIALKEAEAKLIQKYIKPNSIKIVLDLSGVMMTSEKFADTMETFIEASKDIFFVIGGAYGLSKSVLDEADLILSLSKMTMPHLLAKLTLIEQIYRAQSIIHNHPYHK